MLFSKSLFIKSALCFAIIAPLFWLELISPQDRLSSQDIRTSEATPNQPPTLETVLEAVSAVPEITGFILYQNGQVAMEQYWRGHRRDRPQNIKSASKTILSTLVGIAVEQGHIASLDDPVSKYIPRYFENIDEEMKKTITIRHLLTMSSGLESTSFGNYGRWVASRDWVGAVLRGRLLNEPGSVMRYSTGDTHILSAVLATATGKSTRRYAEEVLFRPMGIRVGGWDVDPQGVHFGGNNMALSPDALLRFGQLYLNGGVFRDTRIVSQEWVTASFEDHFIATSFNPRGHNYGYLWWNNRFAGEKAWFAWGYGGQYVFVIPDHDAVVVFTGNPDSRSRGANNFIYNAMDEAVMPWVRGK